MAHKGHKKQSGMVTPRGVTPRKQDTRQRRQVRFMLDAANPTDAAIGRALFDRKGSRQMTPTIRKALRLYLSLEAGNTDVLYELFPQLAQTPSELFASLMAEIATRAPQPADVVTVEPTNDPAPDNSRRRKKEKKKDTAPPIVVTKTEKASSEEVSNNFAMSMAGLFD